MRLRQRPLLSLFFVFSSSYIFWGALRARFFSPRSGSFIINNRKRDNSLVIGGGHAAVSSVYKRVSSNKNQKRRRKEKEKENSFLLRHHAPAPDVRPGGAHLPRAPPGRRVSCRSEVHGGAGALRRRGAGLGARGRRRRGLAAAGEDDDSGLRGRLLLLLLLRLLLLLDRSILRNLLLLLLHLLLGLSRRNGARLPVRGGVSRRVGRVVDLEPDAGACRLAAVAARGIHAERRGVASRHAEARVEALLRAPLEGLAQLLAARDLERGESSRVDAERGGGAGGGGEGQDACGCRGSEEGGATARGSHGFFLLVVKER